MTDQFESPILSKSEGARYTTMSESFLHAHATRKDKEPKLAYIRIGNRLKFRKVDLDLFIEAYANKTKEKLAQRATETV